MKKLFCAILSLSLLFASSMPSFSNSEQKSEADLAILTDSPTFTVNAKSAYLCEASTGKILFSQNAEESLPPASVTKIMTLLLVMEAVDDGRFSLDQEVSVSPYAASMGGSQVFLEEGECMTLEEMLKCTVIASANDAAVALAELVSGSESAFVSAMNSRAEELGMQDSHFENVTGLDDTVKDHRTSARDIAIMSCELLKHEKILEYTGIWQDTIRNGEFTLTNTNRLVRFYDGCNGLKTGSTAKAGYCMSATAKRDGMQLVAVVMGAPTRDERNAIARELLDYGFSTFALYSDPAGKFEKLPVLGGVQREVTLSSPGFSAVVGRGDDRKIERHVEIPGETVAPIEAGCALGKITYILDGETVGEVPIVAAEGVLRITFGTVLLRLLGSAIGVFKNI